MSIINHHQDLHDREKLCGLSIPISTAQYPKSQIIIQDLVINYPPHKKSSKIIKNNDTEKSAGSLKCRLIMMRVPVPFRFPLKDVPAPAQPVIPVPL